MISDKNCDDNDSDDDNMVGNGASANGAENIVDDRYPANANDNLLIWTYQTFSYGHIKPPHMDISCHFFWLFPAVLNLHL